MTAPYADVGPKLIERGYAAIPIIPGTKRPGELVRGEWVGINKWSEITAPSEDDVDRWSDSDAGVGVVCGRGLIGVDIDTDDQEIIDAILSAIPHSEVKKVGAKGMTLFYRANGIESKSWNVDGTRACDLIGPGRQTLLPPTLHPGTGQPYRWIGSEALECSAVSDLPELTQEHVEAIGEALKPFGWKAEKPQQTGVPGQAFDDPETPFRSLNNDALANLPKWVPALGLFGCRPARGGYEAVPTWRASNTGQPLEKRKLNLKLHPRGIVDEGDGPKGYTAIDLVVAAKGCEFDEARKFLTDRLWEHDKYIKITTVAQIVPHEPKEVGFEAQLEALTHCNGVVNQIINWVTETSRIPNRILALGTALTTVGTLIGRRAQGPTKSATHLYVIGLAPTGSGKDRPLKATDALFEAAGALHHVGTSGEWVSMQSLMNDVQAHPLALFRQDEWGSFLRRVNGRKASGFEQSIGKGLRELWSTSFDRYLPPSSAAKKATPIKSPAVSVLAMSTPKEFYTSIRGADIENGFLNRLLILRSDRYVRAVTPADSPIPSSLAAALEELYLWGGTEIETAGLASPDYDTKPHYIEWESPQAKKAFDDFAEFTRERMAIDTDIAPFLSRTAENAVRMATIMAAGRWGPGCAVDTHDMLWALDVSKNCTERAIADAMSSMNKELSHGEVYGRILEMIAAKGGKLSRKDLIADLGPSVRSKREIDQTLELLYEGGRIKWYDVDGAKWYTA
jgi:hypothetical protein